MIHKIKEKIKKVNFFLQLLLTIAMEKKAYIYILLLIRGWLFNVGLVLYQYNVLSYETGYHIKNLYEVKNKLILDIISFFKTRSEAFHYKYKCDDIILVVNKLSLIDFFHLKIIFLRCQVSLSKKGITISPRFCKVPGYTIWKKDFSIKIVSVKKVGDFFIPEKKSALKQYGYIEKEWILDCKTIFEADESRLEIDLVYTWVDDKDPVWLRKKDHYLNSDVTKSRVHHETSYSSSRFKNRNELLYSLRSVEYYAPFVRKIFIVTDDQIPDWLNVNHDKIHIIDHKQIFDDVTHLPTFNSHAIEMHLHRIKDLSEHYIYMNDDFFFRRKVIPEDFFDTVNGNTKAFFSSQRIPEKKIGLDLLPVDTAAVNGQELLKKHFSLKVTNKIKHMPYPQRKSIMNEIYHKFKEFQHTSKARFRCMNDFSLPASFYHHYARITGRAVKDEMPYLYADIGSRHFKSILMFIRLSGKYKTFCINDTGDCEYLAPQKIDYLLKFFFHELYPFKSSFEK